MNKREHITAIKPWKITAGEYTGKWLAGVQWTEGGEQKDRQIDRPRSTFHEALWDADALTRKIEAEGMQGDYPPMVTTLAREKADAEDVLRALGPSVQSVVGVEVVDLPKVRETIDELKAQRDADEVRVKSLTAEIASAIQIMSDCGVDASGGLLFTVRSMADELKREKKRLGDALHEALGHRNAAEQQISDAIEVMHAHGVDVSDGMVASVTALAGAWHAVDVALSDPRLGLNSEMGPVGKAASLAKAWRLLSEMHNATVQELLDLLESLGNEREDLRAKVSEQARAEVAVEGTILAWLSTHGYDAESIEDAGMSLREDRADLVILTAKCRDLEANLDMARKNLSAACEQREEAKRQRDEALELKEVWRAECRNLEENLNMTRKNLSAAFEQKVAEQARAIAALALALADAYGVPKS